MHYLFSGVKITIHFLINGILLYIWATLNIKATHRNPRKRHDWRTYKDMGWVKEWTRDIQAEVTLRHEGRKVCPPVPPQPARILCGAETLPKLQQESWEGSAPGCLVSLSSTLLSPEVIPLANPIRSLEDTAAPRPRKAEQIWGNREEGKRTPVILPITQEGIGKVISHYWGWEGELSPKGGSCTLNYPCNYIRIWAGLVIPWTTLTEGDEKPRIRKVKLGKVIKENIFHNVEV